jgi:predicted dehydrogenase
MRILQIGGGSMGTRRMRDLHGRSDFTSSIGSTDSGEPVEVRLFDARADRRDSARERFSVDSFAALDSAVAWDPHLIVVSTPPDQHAEYLKLAVELGKSVFCEADIWPVDSGVAAAASSGAILIAPSATLLFQPVIQEVARIAAEELGALHAFGYVLSVDAPSWHPGEGAEYYARHRATAPAREMTAFELIALQAIVGHATSVSAVVHRRGSLAIDGEDSYTLQYVTAAGAAGHLSVLMASPQVARRGWLAGENGFVAFDLLSGVVERKLPALAIEDERQICDWAKTLESVYFDEISTFVRATQGSMLGSAWPYSPADNALVCATLGPG